MNHLDRLYVKQAITAAKAELRREHSEDLLSVAERLRAEYQERIDELEARVTDVHTRALRALNHRFGGEPAA